jgi:hypothetical protein
MPTRLNSETFAREVSAWIHRPRKLRTMKAPMIAMIPRPMRMMTVRLMVYSWVVKRLG